jgi:hypothetical protein
VFGDMKYIGERYRPDLALVPIGGNFTMDPQDAAWASRIVAVPGLIKPKAVIPMHYGANPLAKGTADGGGVRRRDGRQRDPIRVIVGGYVQQMENRAGTEKRKIVGAGGNYRFNPTFALFGGHMQRRSEVSPQENKVWALGANIEVSDAATLSVEYFDDRQTGSAALEGSRKVAWVTANYRFSRRTDVYAMLDRNRVVDGYAKPAFMGTLGSQTALSVGLRHRF